MAGSVTSCLDVTRLQCPSYIILVFHSLLYNPMIILSETVQQTGYISTVYRLLLSTIYFVLSNTTHSHLPHTSPTSVMCNYNFKQQVFENMICKVITLVVMYADAYSTPTSPGYVTQSYKGVVNANI